MSRRKSVWSADVHELLGQRPRSIFDEIDNIVAREGTPLVTLPLACEVVERRPAGRPRLHPVGAKRGHGYALTTPRGSPMRCCARGCQRTLKKNATAIVCSPACGEWLRRECEELLDILHGRKPPEELSIYYRCFNPKRPSR
jgi:hypothetical protein